MELVHYWKVIQKSLWLILIILVVGLSAAALYSLNQRPEFESSASILLNPAGSSSLVANGDPQVGQTLADSYSEFMHSQSFAESVVKELPFQMSTDRVAKVITTKLAPNTFFFTISARMDSPQKAQQLISAVVKVFLATNIGPQTNPGAGNAADETAKLFDSKLKLLNDQIKSYQDQIKSIEAQPASKDRDDRLLTLQGLLISAETAETNTRVAKDQLTPNGSRQTIGQIIDEPRPGKRLSGKTLTTMMLALAVSLVLGIGLAFLRDYLDYTVHSTEQLEAVLGLPVVASIQGVSRSASSRFAYLRWWKRRGKANGMPTEHGHALVTLEDPSSPESESFRVMRTNIQFSSLERPIRSLVVTSAVPQEGKSFVASNLAIAMAQAGKRVILVDADLRRPRQHEIFGLTNKVGFTDLVLAGSNSVAGAVQPVRGVNNLAIITSGPLPPNPSELLDSRQASRVIDQLTQQTDMIIFDSPPAGALTDPILLAARMDAVLLVINAGATRKDIIARTKQSLQNVGVAVLLPVLNRVIARGMGGYYNYRSQGGDAREIGSNEGGPHKNGKASPNLVGADPKASSSPTTAATRR